MRNATYFKLALNMLLHSKLRSWLTIIGIVIGVGAEYGIGTWPAGEYIKTTYPNIFNLIYFVSECKKIMRRLILI